jgi:hypothetical protein
MIPVNDGGRGEPGWAMVPPKIREKKIEVKKKNKKNVKFSYNFSHLAPFERKFVPIFRFYGYIQ